MASQSFSIESTVPQAEDEWIRQPCGFYACPVRKQGLEPVHDGLSCRVCARTYPIFSGIPDFIVVNLEESRNRSCVSSERRTLAPCSTLWHPSTKPGCIRPCATCMGDGTARPYNSWHMTSPTLWDRVTGSFWTRPAAREPTRAALLLRQGPFLALISA